jgi:2-oxo-3-hexenedioate decarboxylase
MDWKDAYDIQDEVLARKLRRGARVVGFKAGLTSHAKMKQMNVDSPVFGFLVDEFSVPEGGEVKVSDLIHPKVEAEICFITKLVFKFYHQRLHILAHLSFLIGIEMID